MSKMWAGRFNEANDALLEEFNASIGFDKRLYKEDIAGSIAHSLMLADCGIISQDEASSMRFGLEQILGEIERGEFSFVVSDEDIHMSIEKRLGQIIGIQIAGKLHTARSRNDQVALDFRLYTQRANLKIQHRLYTLVGTLFDIAKQHSLTLMPGFTHLQHAQPVSLAYYLCAYIFMFMRDFDRFSSSYDRADFCPLGSAALAGTPHNINRAQTAKALGFKEPTFNAMDSVSDRDFALEMLFNIATIFTHTSRLCEEIILWCSSEFGFMKLSDKFSTGSSIMPQKKNPDVAELIRGKTGRVYGNLIALLTTLKSLPLAYNKDMQEDKEGLFDSVDTALISLEILAKMLQTSSFDKEAMLKACKKGHLSATDLADYLVRQKGVPFRQAHHITGRAVAYAESIGVDLSELSRAELANIDEALDSDEALGVLSLEKSMQARSSYGGTSVCSVKNQLDLIEKWLEENGDKF